MPVSVWRSWNMLGSTRDARNVCAGGLCSASTGSPSTSTTPCGWLSVAAVRSANVASIVSSSITITAVAASAACCARPAISPSASFAMIRASATLQSSTSGGRCEAPRRHVHQEEPVDVRVRFDRDRLSTARAPTGRGVRDLRRPARASRRRPQPSNGGRARASVQPVQPSTGAPTGLAWHLCPRCRVSSWVRPTISGREHLITWRGGRVWLNARPC